MTTTVLALTGLNCGHCVQSVTQALESVTGAEAVTVTRQFAKIAGDVLPQILIDAVKAAGFGAALAAQPDLHLRLSGLNCGHCIKSTEKALSAVENAEVFDVSKTEAKIYGAVNADEAIKAIVNAGFNAEILDKNSPKPEPLPKSESTENKTVKKLSPDPAAADNRDQAKSGTAGNVLLLEGLSCAACVLKVEHALKAVPNVQNVRVNLAERTALVFGDAQPQAMIDAVVKAGYGAELIEDENKRREKQQVQFAQEIKQRKWQAITALIVGFGLLAWGLFGGNTTVTEENRSYWIVVGIVTLVVMRITGGHFYQRARKALMNGSATMDTLVALGTGIAWLFSMIIALKPDWFPADSRHLYFESGAMIIGLINLGKMLEAKAKQRSSSALERLLDLTPKTMRLINGQNERDVPLDEVKLGDTLRLLTGDRVSVDGSVIQGAVWVDESMLTGESLPVQKSAGDKLSAGTLVTDGSALFVTERIGYDTKLANIIRLVRQAQSSKPQIGQLADKIASVFVPIVVVIAVLAAIVWYFYDSRYSFVVLTTVLIIACPCALGLATPMSIIAGVARAAELGILVAMRMRCKKPVKSIQ